MTVAWTEPRHGELQARHAGRVLHVCVGSPTMFCYSDGDYLGSEVKLDAAKRRCVNGKKGDYVMEMETTAQAWAALPKAKRTELEWRDSRQGHWREWHAEVPDEKLPARIREADKRTYSVYRAGQYLGSESSLEDAKRRAVLGKLSQKNSVMRLWEQTHPDELPPALQLTEAERAEYWRMHPPPRQAAKPVAKVAAPAASLRGPDDGRAPGKARQAKPRGDAAAVPQGTIRVAAGATIPKKPGSGAHGRWTVLWAHDGQTVAAYAKAGGNLSTLVNAMASGRVQVEEDK